MALKLQGPQKEAVEARGCNILVSAAAGAGKTTVMTERILTLLGESGDPCDVDEILALTFTKDAAMQMKKKLEKKLNEAIAEIEGHIEDGTASSKEQEKLDRLKRQIDRIPGADISTIDSFCMRFLKENHYFAGLPGDLKTIDALSAVDLREKAANQIIDELARKEDEGLKALLTYFGTPDNLKDHVYALSGQTSTYSDRSQWFEKARQNYEPDNMRRIVDKLQLDKLTRALDAAENNVVLLEALADAGSEADAGVQTFVYGVRDVAEEIRTLLTASDNDLETVVKSGLNARLPKALRPKKKDSISDIEKNLYKKPKDDINAVFTSDSLHTEQLRRAAVIRPVVNALFDFMDAFEDRFEKLKVERGQIDFGDMERYTLQILKKNPSLAHLYQDRYKHVFVDEYQDTNQVQDEIIRLVSRGRNSFYVGDIKQSIYRFRSADPGLFLKRSADYKNSPDDRLIELTSNFRSARNILNSTNDVFLQIAANDPDMKYSDAVKLSAPSQATRPGCPTVFYELPERAVLEQWNIGDMSSARLESLKVVQYIKERMKKPVWDAELKAERDCRYSDIAVIVRDRSAFKSDLCQLLQTNGIPYFLSSGEKLTAYQEIALLRDILSLADKQSNDAALLAVIHNGFFGFTDDDLLELAADNKKPLPERIAEKAETDSELGRKCQALLAFIDQVREFDSVKPIDTVVEWVIDTLDYEDYCLALGDGRQRLANLNTFIQLAHDFQGNSAHRLYAFLKALDVAEKRGVQINAGKLSNSGDFVNLMTIHGSKGLEYPIVILPYLDKSLEHRVRLTDMAISHEVGFGLKYQNAEELEKGELTFMEEVSDDSHEREQREQLRLLYVAMTRAKEEMVLIGSKDGSFSSLDSNSRGGSDLTFQKQILDVVNGPDPKTGQWECREVTDSILLENAGVRDQERKLRKAVFAPKAQTTAEKVCPVPDAVGASHAHDFKTRKEADPSQIRRFKICTNEIETEESRVDYTEIGTRVHKVLELADFTQLENPGYLEELFSRVDPDKLTDHEHYSMLIRDMFAGGVGPELLKADKTIREKNLQVAMPFSDIDPNYEGDRTTRVLCELDLLAKADGKYILVDYKTDRFRTTELDDGFARELADKTAYHKTQMDLYRKAVRQAYGIELDEVWLGFIDIARFEQVEF